MSPFGAGPRGMPPGMAPGGPLGALNSVQPAPPLMMPPGGGGGLLAMLGGMPDSTDPMMPHTPDMFGLQAGEPDPNPFESMPYQEGAELGGGSDLLIDQLEGMGLGAAPPRPDLSALLGGGGPPGLGGPPGMGGPPPGLGGPPGMGPGGPPRRRPPP